MNLPDDFRDVLVALADAGARFMVIGAGRLQDLADVEALENPSDR